jgi:hypothetical protein
MGKLQGLAPVTWLLGTTIPLCNWLLIMFSFTVYGESGQTTETKWLRIVAQIWPCYPFLILLWVSCSLPSSAGEQTMTRRPEEVAGSQAEK